MGCHASDQHSPVADWLGCADDMYTVRVVPVQGVIFPKKQLCLAKVLSKTKCCCISGKFCVSSKPVTINLCLQVRQKKTKLEPEFAITCVLYTCTPDPLVTSASVVEHTWPLPTFHPHTPKSCDRGAPTKFPAFPGQSQLL